VTPGVEPPQRRVELDPLLAEFLPKVTEAKRLTLNPGDRLVLRFPGRLSQYVAARLVVAVPQYLGMPGLKVLVLDEGADADVLGPGEDPPPAWGRLWQPDHP
jgi:hypothetical protein